MIDHGALSPAPAASATVVGAGPAGLMAAERLALGGVAVTLVDRMARPGRKLLMAGVGGLNLTFEEPMEAFLALYGPAAPHLAAALAAFPPEALRQWCAELGVPTFVGSSRRVFPVAMKASPLLRAWLRRLAGQGVVFRPGHRWVAPGQFDPALDTPQGATVLALGGASWPRLGSDGAWAAGFPPGSVAPLCPANCGFTVAWSDHLRTRFAGTPLKRIAVNFGGRRIPGEAMLTQTGIEGGPFYTLGPALRQALDGGAPVVVTLDLRPDLTLAEIGRRLAGPRGSQSLSTTLRRALALPPVAISLLRECAGALPDLAAAIKSLPLPLAGTTGLDRAISTAGGLRFDAALPPGLFAAGEMLDWEAPTGGYLLQAAFSTGYSAGEAALAWLGSRAPSSAGRGLSR